MSYQVLARKWRPSFFDEMVGQEHVLRALINALNEQRLHHAYLFTGTRGVGKTTIARILAKCLNCEQGISARPCGECSACQEIASGRFVDLIEVDAASRTKVEDTRELLDNVQYAPTRGRFKVYLIDEVHMLSTHSFNALLKTLEEPPEHVKFLLATTDPQKLPITVLSRCLQFSLKNMTPESIVGYLENVLNAEQVGYESPALWQLGRAAQGSMRDALSLTDQAIAFGEGQVTESQVTSMLGTMDRGRLFRLAEIMAIGDATEVMAEAAEMSAHGPDFDEIIQGLMAIWHRAAVAQVLPDAIENSQGDRDAILMLARAMNGEDLQLYYQIALSGRPDLAIAPDPRQGFEMLLLRMLAFRPALETVPELDVTTALQQSVGEKKKSLAEPATSSDVTFHAVDETSSDSFSSERLPEEPRSEPCLEPRPELHPEQETGVDASGAVDDVAVASALPEHLPSTLADQTHEEAPSSAVPAYPASAPALTPPASAPALTPPVSGAISPDSTYSSPIASDSLSPKPLSPEAGPLDGAVVKVATETLATETLATEALATEALASEPDKPVNMMAGRMADIMNQPVSEPVTTDHQFAETPSPVAQESEPEENASDELPDLVPHTWWQWLDVLPLAGLPLAIARNSALVTVSYPEYHFEVDAQQGALFNDGHRQKIEQALRTLLPDCRITMALGVPTGETPEQRRQRLDAEAGYIAQQSIESDAAVQAIITRFNAVVLPNSIRPFNPQEN